MDLSLRLLADAAGAKGAFSDLGSAALAFGDVLTKLSKESLKLYAEAERGQRQLKLAAGEYTGALNAQAEAMKRKFAVDDDEIRHMQVLLLRYGAAPGAIEKTTEAILDYAAATGKDATSATEQLIRGVESGSGSLGKMGVHFKSTGQFSKDLASAVDALGKKFGGAGVEDAQSLDGRMRAAGHAADDAKKAFGSMLAEIENKHHILERFANTMNRIASSIDEGGWSGFFHALGLSRPADLDFLPERQAAIRGASFVSLKGAGGGLPMKGAGDHKVGGGKGGKDEDFGWGPWGDPEKSFEGWQQEYDLYKAKQAADIIAHDFELKALADKRAAEELKDEEKHDETMLKQKRELANLELDIEYDKNRRIQAERDKADAEQRAAFQRQVEDWKMAGAAMGAALVNAIGEQLQRLAEGQEASPVDMLGDIVGAVLGIAGFAIGAYIGGPAGAQIGGAIGGIAGGLASYGIKSAGRKKHDGGWIERFHSGGWPLGGDEVPALLQTGERVLSRREVSRMGGPSGVDAAARGRGNMTVNIHALDAQSFQDSMGDRGGRGIYNAIRVGRGDLVPLFT